MLVLDAGHGGPTAAGQVRTDRSNHRAKTAAVQQWFAFCCQNPAQSPRFAPRKGNCV